MCGPFVSLRGGFPFRLLSLFAQGGLKVSWKMGSMVFLGSKMANTTLGNTPLKESTSSSRK